MKLMVIILNKTDALDSLLEGMSAAGLGGATIIESSGLATTLSRLDSSIISASIRAILSGAEEDNRTILSVIRNDQLEIARKVVYNTVGDLSHPNTGIMFTVPIDFVEGTRKNRSSFEPAIAEPDEQTAVQQQSKEPEKAAKKHKLFGRNKKSRNEES
ncbi:hypothetical protein [Ruminococcus sp. FC2018]|uniref:hypothetical protein n=1 Tax=Ruminococcus sp. FC2018 TaxID=1410617 RepID=UPI000686C83B|nr:hypothetical protein [Ruminococcus sp. FC2018]